MFSNYCYNIDFRYNLRDASPSKSSTQNDTFKLSALSRKPINVKFKPRKSNRTNVKFDFGSDQYLKFTSESQFNKTFMVIFYQRYLITNIRKVSRSLIAKCIILAIKLGVNMDMIALS